MYTMLGSRNNYTHKDWLNYTTVGPECGTIMVYTERLAKLQGSKVFNAEQS